MLKTITAAELQRMSDEELTALSMKEGEKMLKCPLTGKDCAGDCAWYGNGECCIAALPYLTEKLEDVNDSIRQLEHTIKNTDFTM